MSCIQSQAKRIRQLPGFRAEPVVNSHSIVEGDNRPGLGYAIARSVADAGIKNSGFMVAQVIGRRCSPAVFGFETEDDARKATALIKKATLQKKR